MVILNFKKEQSKSRKAEPGQSVISDKIKPAIGTIKTILDFAYQQGEFNRQQSAVYNLIKQAECKLSDRVCKASTECFEIVSCKYQQGIRLPENEHQLNKKCFKSMINPDGELSKREVSELWHGITSADPKIKNQALKVSNEIINNNSKDITTIKLIAGEIVEFNKNSEVKVEKAEKILKQAERLEEQLRKFFSDFREFRSRQEAKIISFKPLLPVLPDQEKEKAVSSLIPEDKKEFKKKSEEIPDKVKHHYNGLIDSLQAARGLMVDIAGIEQELDFLKGRHSLFDKTDPQTATKIIELENLEAAMQHKLKFYLTQACWN